MEAVANLGSSLALAAHLRVQHGEGRLRFSQAPLHAKHLLLPPHTCAQAWHNPAILHLGRPLTLAQPLMALARIAGRYPIVHNACEDLHSNQCKTFRQQP